MRCAKKPDVYKPETAMIKETDIAATVDSGVGQSVEVEVGIRELRKDVGFQDLIKLDSWNGGL